MSKEFATALASSDTVAVVGVGNVALDCARILAKGKNRSLRGLRLTFILFISHLPVPRELMDVGQMLAPVQSVVFAQ